MGPFSLKDAWTLEDIEKDPEGAVISDLHPILSALPAVELSEKEGADFLQGKRIRFHGEDCGRAAVFCGPRFLGIASLSKGIIHPKKVFS